MSHKNSKILVFEKTYKHTTKTEAKQIRNRNKNSTNQKKRTKKEQKQNSTNLSAGIPNISAAK